MSLYTLGEVANLQLTTYNSSGVPTDAGAVTLSITQPDGTAASIGSIAHTASTGIYTYAFTPTMLGRHKVTWQATGANATVDIHSLDVYGATIATPAELRARFAGGDLSSTTTYPDSLLREALRGATQQWADLAQVPPAPWAELITWVGEGTMARNLPRAETSSVVLKIDGVLIPPTNYILTPTGVLQLLGGLFTVFKTCTAFVTYGLAMPPRPVVDAILQRATELALGSNVPSRTIAQGGDLGYTRYALANKNDGTTGIPDFDATATLYGRATALGFA